MLTQTLRSLERDGLVERKVYPVVPPKVEYSLSKLGRTLIEPLRALCRWSEKHLAELQANRDRKSTRLNSSHLVISYAVFCLKRKTRLSFLNSSESRGSSRILRVPGIILSISLKSPQFSVFSLKSRVANTQNSSLSPSAA